MSIWSDDEKRILDATYPHHGAYGVRQARISTDSTNGDGKHRTMSENFETVLRETGGTMRANDPRAVPAFEAIGFRRCTREEYRASRADDAELPPRPSCAATVEGDGHGHDADTGVTHGRAE